MLKLCAHSNFYFFRSQPSPDSLRAKAFLILVDRVAIALIAINHSVRGCH
jgi:hypothetical protein